MSASLSSFIHQCLSEEKYGKQYVSEIEDRIESLNYAQLEGMHKVLTESSKNARIHCWKSANDEILKHVEKWKAIKGAEYRRMKELEAELLRKIREKEKNRLREIHAKESVIRQLKNNARKDAEKEIAEYEFQRKATYKMELHALVPKAEEKRNSYFKYAAGSFVVGLILCITVGIIIKQPFVIIVGIGLMVLLALLLVRKGIKAGRVAPYEEDEDVIARSVDVREEELFMKAMNQLRQSDEEYRQRMLLDKEERRKRKAERKEQEMIRLALLAAGDDDDDDSDDNDDKYEEGDDDDDDDHKEGAHDDEVSHDMEREEKEGEKDDKDSDEKVSVKNVPEEIAVVDSADKPLRRNQYDEKDEKSIMEMDDMSSISESVSFMDIADKKNTVHDFNDKLAYVASGRGPPDSSSKDSPRAGTIGPPISNPRGPPISNPRDHPGAGTIGPPISNPRGSPISNPRDHPGAGTIGPPISNPRGPPISNPRDHPGAGTIGPPISNPNPPLMSNPKVSHGTEAIGPPISNPRGPPNPVTDLVVSSEETAEVENAVIPALTFVQSSNLNADVVSVMITDFTDKIVMTGQAFVKIRVEDSNGQASTELITDTQNVSGESLFWRFNPSSHDASGNLIESKDVLYIKDILGEECASLTFELIFIRDGQKDEQAVLTMSKQEIKESIASSDGSEAPILLTGLMNRNDVVNICSLTVNLNLC